MSLRNEYETEKNSGRRTFAGDHGYDEWLANKGREQRLAETGYYPSGNEKENNNARTRE